MGLAGDEPFSSTEAMKLVRKVIEKDRSGEVILIPEDSEDFWYTFNLIHEGDELETKSWRRIVKAGEQGQGSKANSTRKLMKLKIRVQKIEFDPGSSSLRLGGRVVEDLEEVSAGSFHTLELEMNRKFALFKQEWDFFSFEQLKKATNVENKAEVGAVIMQEGLANICLITENMTLLRQRVEQNLPRKKRGDNSGYEKSLQRFYQTTYETMKRNLPIDKLKAILIASPGFVASGFYNYIFEKGSQAEGTDNKSILKQKSKFVVTHSSSGHVHSLEEVLQNEDVQKQLSDTKYGHEAAVLDKFFKILNVDDGRAWYGPRHVEEAIARGAVSSLLITDTLFRSNDIATRRKYIRMVEDVQKGHGEVLIFSSMHESGEQLDQVTGIACILNFPLPELEDLDDDD